MLKPAWILCPNEQININDFVKNMSSNEIGKVVDISVSHGNICHIKYNCFGKIREVSENLLLKVIRSSYNKDYSSNEMDSGHEVRYTRQMGSNFRKNRFNRPRNKY